MSISLFFAPMITSASHAVLVQPLDLGIDGRRAHTARNEENALAAQLVERLGHEVRRTAQRSGEVGQRVARFQCADLARGDTSACVTMVTLPCSGS